MDIVDNCTLTFTGTQKQGSVTINLCSHYTLIIGENSGEGKSHFFNFFERRFRNSSISITNSMGYSILFATTSSALDGFLKIPQRCIIFVDEILLSQGSGYVASLNVSNHLFIVVARNSAFNISAPMNGIYEVKRWIDGGTLFFDLIQVKSLRLYSGNKIVDFDFIVTESRDGRSEHQLLSEYLDKDIIIAAYGNTRIYKKLTSKVKSGVVLVLMDLSNMSGFYSKLRNLCEKRKDLYFYDYNCFEELLYKSRIIPKNVDVGSVFDYLTVERYYEALLMESTSGTDLCVKHGQKLPAIYLDKSNFDAIFNTDIGKGLYILIKNSGDSNVPDV